MICKLIDYANITMGQSPASKFYNSSGLGTPFLQGNRTFGRKYPSFDTWTTSVSKMARKGDVIMSVRAPVGELNIAPDDFCLGRGVCSIRSNDPNQEFLFYLLKYSISRLLSKQTGTVFGSVNRNDIGNLVIDLPSYERRTKIGRILSAIDLKIQINERINGCLEAQAERLFERELLRFEDLPEGWKLGSLLDIADYTNGLAMQKYRPLEGSGMPVLKIKELRQGFCDSESERCDYGIDDNYHIQDKDVIFSWSGSLLVDFWCGGHCGLNQHLFKVSSKKYPKWFFYAWTKHYQEHFAGIAAGMATTMGHIKRSELAKAKVLIPNPDDFDRIGLEIEPLYKTIISRRLENARLSMMRDSLLPKLMSGEIHVDSIRSDQ